MRRGIAVERIRCPPLHLSLPTRPIRARRAGSWTRLRQSPETKARLQAPGPQQREGLASSKCSRGSTTPVGCCTREVEQTGNTPPCSPGPHSRWTRLEFPRGTPFDRWLKPHNTQWPRSLQKLLSSDPPRCRFDWPLEILNQAGTYDSV